MTTSTQQKQELFKAIWAIAEDLRNSVDGWDFKSYVLGILFYRFISENITNYVNKMQHEAGDTDFDYAKFSDEEAESAREQRTKINSTMGFSIKSQLGGDSTLLNASGATNFSYRVEGCDFSDEEIEAINAIDTRRKIIDRIAAIRAKGADLVFHHVDNDTFRKNLAMLDGDLAATIAQLLVEQFNTGTRMFDELAKALAETNPLGFDKDDAESMYIYKLKHLLTSAALGMMPGKKWSGKFDANGGYLVVKKDGEILCYHFYDRNRFEDFLFRNAYLERGKTRRHGYASLYRSETAKFTSNPIFKFA